MRSRHQSVNRFTTAKDNWTKGSLVIIAPDTDSDVKAALDRSPIIVQHRFYRGGSSPKRLVLDDCEDYKSYLSDEGRAGDAIDIWIWEDVCNDENRAAFGKCPDDDGYVPLKGAY